jgi:hypothetical protein
MSGCGHGPQGQHGRTEVECTQDAEEKWINPGTLAFSGRGDENAINDRARVSAVVKENLFHELK